MEDGPYRARRSTEGRRRAQDDSEDVLARHGLLGFAPDSTASGGRAARRRAAERETPPADDGRHVVESPSDPQVAPPPDRPRRRYRTDEPDAGDAGRFGALLENGYAVAPPEAPSRGAAAPSGGGGRRRAPEPFDVPQALDPTTAGPTRRGAPGPDSGAPRQRHSAEPGAAPATGGRRRRAADPDEPYPPRGGRADPAIEHGATGRRRADPADEPPAPRWAAEAPEERPARRRYADLPDEPRARRRPVEPADELPARRRATHEPDEPPRATGAPDERPGRRRYADFPDEPRARRRPTDLEDEPPARRRATQEPDEPPAPGWAAEAPVERPARRRATHEPDEPPAPRRTTGAPDDPPGRRRYADLPDEPRARRRPTDLEGEPPALGRSAQEPPGTRRWSTGLPQEPPARRRAIHEPDEPAARRRAVDPAPGSPPARRHATHVPDGPVAPRRATVAPDEPPAARRTARLPAEPAARRGTSHLPEEPPVRQQPPRRRRPPEPALPADTGLPRRPDPYDEPYDPPVGRKQPEPAAPRRGRQRPEGSDGPPARHPAADIGRPAHSGGGQRYRPEPPVAPEGPAPVPPAEPGSAATTAVPAAAVRGRRRGGEPEPDAPPTTALPTGGGARGRRPEPVDAPVEAAATTAIPVRRRGSEPAAQVTTAATTALPASRRRPAEVTPPDDAPPRGGRPDNPATTVLPAGGGRRPRADTEQRDGDGAPEPRTSGRSTPAGGGDGPTDREVEAHTRAMRIDETLTRLTAAHAGVTLAVTDRPAVEPAVPAPRRGPAVIAGRLLAGAVALLVLAATAFGWGTKTWLGSAVRDAAALDPSSSAVVDAAVQAGDENVLVVATEPATETAEPRASTVAVAHIPDSGGPVTVLAFPLDLEINRPPCETWDAATASYREEPVQAEARTQLVSALDLGGPRCITRVVQQLSGLAITKYVGIDLAAVPALTDAVGGAEVCVPRPVLDDVLGPVVPDAGPNRLEGVRVADFVQAGEVEGEPSAEYGLIQRQQQVVAAVLDSAVSGTALLDVGRIMALRPVLGDAVVADGAGIDQVLALAMTLRRLDADGVRYAAVPVGENNGRGNAVIRDTEAAALFAAVRADQPLPADSTGPGAGTAGPAPSEVSVQVVNASTRSGLAGEVSETLNSLGFDVGEPESADQPTTETVIRFSPDQAAAAEVLRATVPSASEVPDPGSTGVLQLVLGQSFDDVVRAPSEPIALTAPTTEASAEPAVTCT